MSEPVVILIPPTPLASQVHPPILAGTALSRSSQSTESAGDQEVRSSSETAIFTIYSMYGDEAEKRATWDEEAAQRDGLSEAYSKSFNFFKRLSSAPPKAPPTPDPEVEIGRALMADNFDQDYPAASTSNGPQPAPQPASRRSVIDQAEYRLSAIAASTSTSSDPGPSNHTRPPRARPPSPHRSSRTSVMVDDEDHPPRMEASRTRIRTTSNPQLRKSSVYSVHEIVELPPIPIISVATPSPPRSRKPSVSPSRSNLKAPRTPPTGKPPPPASTPSSRVSPSPSSITSLAPSDGEDPDAFHVRSTYAHLDVYGVKGDGFEDGVERTRAKVGGSRASQLNAENALADASEKQHELNEKEIEILASLDRCARFIFIVPAY